jgi:hypothetical protein
VELQEAKQRFEQRGIKLAAISYDSPAILKDFSGRHEIQYPLLADADSKIIRTFDVLNTEATGMTKGMARPGFFYIDNAGVIRDKFFEVNYLDRFTPNDVIVKMFPELAEEVIQEEVKQHVEAPHLQLSLAQSDRVVVPGNRISLIAEIQLPPDVHVYSPEVKGYKPIQLALQPSPEIQPASLTYPHATVLYLDAIKEHVPVFEGKFRIIQEITVSRSKDFVGSLGSGKTIAVTGELKYQACDKTICYIPSSVPVKWELRVTPLDGQRSPEAIQHK